MTALLLPITGRKPHRGRPAVGQATGYRLLPSAVAVLEAVRRSREGPTL
ncbi:hypothetical protein [Streptomyces virginiae]